ncbi:MAG: hypothetical protein MR902_02960 [Campylobacter sp.]|nr:hypothetical protein [Campylobacter sp.]
MTIGLLITAIAIVAIVIYTQILKFEANPNSNLVRNDALKYGIFATEILKEIEYFEKNLDALELKDGKDRFDLKRDLQDLTNELDFIIQTHKNLQDSQRWETKLFHVLDKLSKINEEYLVDFQNINETQKDKFYDIYKGL